MVMDTWWCLAHLERRWSKHICISLLGKWNSYCLLCWWKVWRSHGSVFHWKNTHCTLATEALDAGPTSSVQWLSSAVLNCVSKHQMVSVGCDSDTVPVTGEVVMLAIE